MRFLITFPRQHRLQREQVNVGEVYNNTSVIYPTIDPIAESFHSCLTLPPWQSLLLNYKIRGSN